MSGPQKFFLGSVTLIFVVAVLTTIPEAQTAFYASLRITGNILVPKDCLAGAVPYAFIGDTDTGLCAPETKQVEVVIDSAPIMNVQDTGTSDPMITLLQDVVDGSNFESLQIAGGGTTNWVIGANKAGTGTQFGLTLRGNVNTGTGWTLDTNNNLITETDGAVSIGDIVNQKRPANAFLQGGVFPGGASIVPAQPTGTVINDAGQLRDVTYKIAVSSTAFVCAATTCDVTIGTLPAKTQVRKVVADLTTVFACASTCTSSTLSMVFGRGSGGAQWLASFDADAAVTQLGDADTELGSTMTRAVAVQGGSFESWSSTQPAVLRLISGTGNIGNGSVTNLSQGSVMIYLTTHILP